MTKWSDKEAAVRKLERGGKVDPLDLINAAREPTHPCHDDFTWDVDKAASERWRDQARAIIRQCRFEVRVDDMTQRVVHYVPSTEDDGDLFMSLPKIRSKGKTSALLSTELAMLAGLTSRVYGIALAKQNIVGADVVVQLAAIRDMVNELKAGMDE